MKYLGDNIFEEEGEFYVIAEGEYNTLIFKQIRKTLREELIANIQQAADIVNEVPFQETEHIEIQQPTPQPKSQPITIPARANKPAPLCKECGENPARQGQDGKFGNLCEGCYNKMFEEMQQAVEEEKPKKKGLFGRKK